MDDVVVIVAFGCVLLTSAGSGAFTDRTTYNFGFFVRSVSRDLFHFLEDFLDVTSVLHQFWRV